MTYIRLAGGTLRAAICMQARTVHEMNYCNYYFASTQWKQQLTLCVNNQT